MNTALLSAVRSYSDHEGEKLEASFKDPHVQRWHAVKPPKERKFGFEQYVGGVDGNPVATPEIMGLRAERSLRAYMPGKDPYAFVKDMKAGLQGAQNSLTIDSEKALRETKLTMGYHGIEPQHVQEGLERALSAVRGLTQAVLSGKRGEGPAGKKLAKLISGVGFHLSPLSHPAHGTALKYSGGPVFKADRVGLYLHPMDLALAVRGHPQMEHMTPEAMVAHEYAHLLDLLGTHATAKRGETDLQHPVHDSLKAPYSAFSAHEQFSYLHDGLGKHSQALSGGAQYIPRLTGPLSRLHYPTGGVLGTDELTTPLTPAGHVAHLRSRLALEWPSVLSELAITNPESSIYPLDRLIPSPDGEQLHEKLNRFWWFDFAPPPPREGSGHSVVVDRKVEDLIGQLSEQSAHWEPFAHHEFVSRGINAKGHRAFMDSNFEEQYAHLIACKGTPVFRAALDGLFAHCQMDDVWKGRMGATPPQFPELLPTGERLKSCLQAAYEGVAPLTHELLYARWETLE